MIRLFVIATLAIGALSFTPSSPIERFSRSTATTIISSSLSSTIPSSSVPAKENDDSIWKFVDSNEKIKNMLVCGDGDLSFSASIAQTVHNEDICLTATVLEDQEAHGKIYQRSISNAEQISNFENHKVEFSIDATKLEETFPGQTFDRIQFNFPHWKGKANHRYNRQLIDAFLKSASKMISDDGEIHMALVQGQGGYNAKTLTEYRDTWTPLAYAADHGLLLANVKQFDAMYNLSSHRGVDRGFKIGQEPKMFIFRKEGKVIPTRNQLCCRHELHILLPDSEESLNSQMDIMEGDKIKEIIQEVVPTGIRVEVPARSILLKEDTGYETNMAIYMIVYCGESKSMKRDEADKYRHLAEVAVEEHVPLRENRKGRLVSKPFPYHLLESVVADNGSYGLMKSGS